MNSNDVGKKDGSKISGFSNRERGEYEGWIEGLCDGYKNWQTWLGLHFFFTLSQLYVVIEVLGLLYQWPWVRWNCYEMAATLEERCP